MAVLFRSHHQDAATGLEGFSGVALCLHGMRECCVPRRLKTVPSNIIKAEVFTVKTRNLLIRFGFLKVSHFRYWTQASLG
jgi:hypothetical protein